MSVTVVTQIPSDMEHFVTRLENYLLGLISQTLSPRGHEDGLRLPKRPSVTDSSLRYYDYDWESRPIDMKTQTRRHQPWRTHVMVTASETPDIDSEYSSTEEPSTYCNVREKRFIKRRGSQGETESDAEDDTASNIVKKRKRTVRRRRRRTISVREELIFGMDVIS